MSAHLHPTQRDYFAAQRTYLVENAPKMGAEKLRHRIAALLERAAEMVGAERKRAAEHRHQVAAYHAAAERIRASLVEGVGEDRDWVRVPKADMDALLAAHAKAGGK